MMLSKLQNDIDVYLSYSNLLDDNHKVIFLSESESNINFLIDVGVEKYVFRLNKLSELGLRNQIRYEYDALKTLERSYVTPTTFFLDDSTTFFEYGVLIMQYIEGRPLEYRKDLQEAAKIFGTIHSLDTKKIDTSSFLKCENIVEDSLIRSRNYLDGFLKSNKLDMDVKLKISKFLEWGENNKKCGAYFKKDAWNTINNTEPHAKNFIISDRKRKGFLIDWEKPILSDPSVDLAYFLSPLSTFMTGDYIFTEDERDNFFKTYIMYLDRYDRDIIERVRIYTPFLYLELLSKLVSKFIKLEDGQDTKHKRIKQIVNIDFINKLTRDVL